MWVPEKTSQTVAVSVGHTHRVTVSGMNGAAVTHTLAWRVYERRPTFPSRMVSHVARFLLTGLSSIPCMDTSYSPSSSCNLLQTRGKTVSLKKGGARKGFHNSNDKKLTCSYQRQSSVQHRSPWSLPPLCEMNFSSFYSEYLLHLCTKNK